MKVALVYDRVNKIGGAERVLVALNKLFPNAPLYTLVHDQKKANWSVNFKVIPSFFNYFNFFRTRHEILAPFAGLAFESFDFANFDLIISITSAESKAVLTKPNTMHLCYCLTPTRYLWSAPSIYRKQSFLPLLFDRLLSKFQKADLVYASRPDYYLAISAETKHRLRKYYQVGSEIIYPPINYEFFSALPRKKDPKFYLVVSRLVPYKRVDLVIKAFKKLKLPLVIVGDGSELKNLQSLAGNSSVSFLGQIGDKKLRDLYRSAKAVIFPQEEDFGLVPLEAAATGTPTIAFAKGGALETILPFKTGIFFKKQTVNSLINAVKKYENKIHAFKSEDCRKHAKKFSQTSFLKAFNAKVKRLWQQHQTRLSSL